MAIRNDREYRITGKFNIETREDGEQNMVVEGYASTFEPYLLFRDDGVDFYEEIDPRAFEEADMSDVVFLRDHTGPVLARTRNGLISLEIDSHGLKTRTDLKATEQSRAMYEDIAVGNYDQMSFSFTVVPGTDQYIEEGNRITRRITKIAKLYDVSAVAFPANPGTDIGISARSLFDGVIERREAERLKSEQRANDIAKLKLKVKIAKELNHGN